VEIGLSQIQTVGGTLVLSSIVDIRERKRADDNLRAALEQLQLITDNMAAGVTRCSRDLRFVWVSRSYAAWLGRAPEEIAGRPILEVVGQEVDVVIRPYIERVLSGERVEYETQVKYPETGRRWIHVVYVPTKALDRTVDGWIGVIADVTERREAEERLRRSEERFRATFFQAAVGIAQTSIDGQWLLLNDRFCEILGYSREELREKTFVDITHSDDREAYLNATRKLIAGEISSWSSQTRYIRKDGLTVWARIFVSLVGDQHNEALYFVAVVEDITDRVRAQEKLRESEARYRALVSASSDVIYRMSPDWTEMRYLRGKDFITDTETPSSAWLQKYIHPEDQPPVVAAINRAVSAKSLFKLEHRVLRKDGTLGWTSSRAIPMLNAAGEIVEWFGTAKDITERKRAEEKLRESEARFRNMADAAPVMIWVSGPDKGCIFFNKVWLDFTGRTMEQESGNGWTEGVHPDDRGRCLAIYSASFEARRSFRMEYRLRRGDGEYRWLLDNGVPRFAVGRVFEGYIGSCIDITERKYEERLREELQRERERSAEARGMERFRLSFEEAPVGMALIRGDGLWLRVNRALCEMTGYTESELISRGREITHPDDRAEESLLLSQILSGQVVAGRLEERCLHKYGYTIYVLLSIAVVERDEAGRPVHFVAHVQDLTDRKRVEQELEASRAQIVSSSRLSALGMMAGGIAHEINNPLAVIYASAANISRMAESGSVPVPAVLKNCNRISLTADRISRIVRSLRHVARESSADEFRETPVREIVDETLELCAERFRANNIRLAVSVVEPSAVISCREVQMCQLLLNLLQNAYDELVDREGERWVKLDVTYCPGWVVLSVSDSGAGISPENRAHIMEPFFTTKPVGKGTGLGLSISRSIAMEHGGTLELDEESPYTCFRLKLPLLDIA
jgi:PAS domain S-box-containing protein